MKLYATVTSERASKGQGGNEWIEVELKVEDRVTPIGYIMLDYIGNEWIVKWKAHGSVDAEIIAQGKGKR